MCDAKFDQIILYYAEWQPMYAELAGTRSVDFRQGTPRGGDFEENSGPKLVIMDDLMSQLDKTIVEIFTRVSHHRNLSVFFLSQNLFHKGQREISLNSSYIVIFQKSARQSSNCAFRSANLAGEFALRAERLRRYLQQTPRLSRV